MNAKTISSITLLTLVFFSHSTIAGELTIPNTFVSGTPAVAAEVNANFTAIKAEVDDNANAIAGNITSVSPGSGLVGGGTEGAVTLGIGSGDITGAHLGTDSVESGIHIVDEPGITSSGRSCSYPIIIGGCSTTVTTANMHVTSVSITPPGPGFVFVTFSGRSTISHTTGTRDNLQIEIDSNSTPNVCNAVGFNSTCNSSYRYEDVDANLPSGNFTRVISSQAQFSVSSSAPVTYYLEAKSSKSTGITIGEYSMSVMYFPTSY
jgi:hypothetical protein